MNFNRIAAHRRKHLCNTHLTATEQPVQNGLAFTPADLLRLTRKGLPISPQNLPESMYSDNDHTAYNDFSVHPAEERGACMAGVWEAQQEARKRIRNAYHSGHFVQPVTKVEGGHDGFES